MKAAVIKNNIVENIIIADLSVFSALESTLNATICNVDTIECGIGWTTSDGGLTFISPPEPDMPEDPYAIIDILTGEVE